MRLGQLARKLDVTSTDIVRFLSEKQININDHPNVKLEDDIEQQVIDAFSEDEIVATEIQTVLTINEVETGSEETSTPKEVVAEEDDTTAIQVEDTANNPEQTPEPPETPQQQENEEVEIIKAPKIELQGLKVIGKIDLPETQSKENPDKAEETKESLKSKRNQKKKHSKGALTEEEKEKRRIKRKKARLKQEKLELEKRKEQEQKHLKRLKKEHYLKKVNKRLPTDGPRKTKNVREVKAPTENRPKTVLGRFWKWLNT